MALCAAGTLSFYDPRAGNAWFKDDQMQRQYHQYPLDGFQHPHVVKPKTGDLVIFSPYVYHGVGHGTNDKCVSPRP